MKLQAFIEIDNSKRFGRPILKGTRISVVDILQMLANGMSREDILLDFPELTDQMILASLSYAADREQISRVAS